MKQIVTRWLMRFVVVVGSSASLLAMQAGEASAMTNAPTGGAGQVYAVNTVDGYGGNPVANTVAIPSRYAWRSSSYAGYTQKITVDYWVYRCIQYGSHCTWQLADHAVATANVAPSSPGVWLGGWNSNAAYGYHYTVTAVVTWSTLNGTVIGQLRQYYNEYGDYSCKTDHCYMNVMDGVATIWV